MVNFETEVYKLLKLLTPKHDEKSSTPKLVQVHDCRKSHDFLTNFSQDKTPNLMAFSEISF